MTITPAQLWYVTHIHPKYVTDEEAQRAYALHGTKAHAAMDISFYEQGAAIVNSIVGEVEVNETPQELADFLKVLDNSLQQDLHQTILLKRVGELRAFLESNCAKSTSLTVQTRKDGDKLIHEFVISAK